jgi:hypothetical protein
MADPVTMMVAATAVTAGSQAFGAISTSKAEKYNASIARQNQTTALAQAAEEANRVRRAGDRRLGTMRAGFGAGNIAASSGSAAAVLVDQARQTELDALTVKYQGDLQARQWASEAQAAKQRGKNALIGGFLGVGASLLGGASSLKGAGSPAASTGGGSSFYSLGAPVGTGTVLAPG